MKLYTKMRLTTKSLIVELFKSVSTCFDWSHIERFYLTREIGGKILRTISRIHTRDGLSV